MRLHENGERKPITLDSPSPLVAPQLCNFLFGALPLPEVRRRFALHRTVVPECDVAAVAEYEGHLRLQRDVLDAVYRGEVTIVSVDGAQFGFWPRGLQH